MRKIKQGVCHTVTFPFTLKTYFKAKEELWKLKFLKMQDIFLKHVRQFVFGVHDIWLNVQDICFRSMRHLAYGFVLGWTKEVDLTP
jgi:hypothetical protein